MTRNIVARFCSCFLLVLSCTLPSSAQYSSSNNLGIVRTYKSLWPATFPRPSVGCQ